MNQVLKNLAQEAYTQGYKICEEVDHKVGNNDTIFCSIIMGTLTELLIKECVNIVSNTRSGYGDYRDQISESMRDACVERINNHFGMEK